MPLKLNSPVSDIKGIGDKFAGVLNDQGVFSVSDLLLHFPVAHIDLSSTSGDVHLNAERLYLLNIGPVRVSRNFKRRRSVLHVQGTIGDLNIHVVFFNQPYLKEVFDRFDAIRVFGRVEVKNDTYQMINPQIFPGTDGQGIIPVYPKISTLKSGQIRNIMKNVFSVLKDDVEILPDRIIRKNKFQKIDISLKSIHFPERFDPGLIEKLKKRFIYEELFFFQLELLRVRNRFKQVKRNHRYIFGEKVRAAISQGLEFDLTADQTRAFEDIVNDLKSDFAMQRLLQGDVGVGKTIVAFLALLVAKENNFQGAFLAPTEILTNQHFMNAGKFFKNVEIEVLTGSTPPKKREAIREKLREGKIDIVFGTHALLNENLKFKNIALVVIDEQHRFGVSQRAALYTKGKAVDLLVTTATPIPRTMLLTLFNDLQVSSIREAPAGRLPIKTKIIQSAQRIDFFKWIKKRVEGGDKVFIVVPLIEKSDFFSKMHSIEEDSEFYRDIFSPFPIGIISGKDPGREKDRVLRDFLSSRIRILVCTTVIEVGIDIRDSSIMIIENADRYGLAQLHQLRGRVGRGDIQSYCYLIQSDDPTVSGRKRLDIIASKVNGFEIAEMDLKMRGGGMIAGFEQSGFLDFKVADIKEHYPVFIQARKDASEILNHDELQNTYVKEFLRSIDKKIESITFG